MPGRDGWQAPCSQWGEENAEEQISQNEHSVSRSSLSGVQNRRRDVAGAKGRTRSEKESVLNSDKNRRQSNRGAL